MTAARGERVARGRQLEGRRSLDAEAGEPPPGGHGSRRAQRVRAADHVLLDRQPRPADFVLSTVKQTKTATFVEGTDRVTLRGRQSVTYSYAK